MSLLLPPILQNNWYFVQEKDIRPDISELAPVNMRSIIASAWDSDPSKRQSFSAMKKSLKGAKHSKKSVMDSLMEVLEGYVNQLEDKVGVINCYKQIICHVVCYINNM